jgi:hypothetical protein
VKEDRRANCRDLAFAHGVLNGTMHSILRDDLGLVKKSARWVPKLLNEDQKQERVQTCKEFVAAVQRRSMVMLDCIITMDETMVSYHTPETKKQSKQQCCGSEIIFSGSGSYLDLNFGSRSCLFMKNT